MSNYIFSGSAMGFAAQFHRLDDVENLCHVVPTLGSSVLAPTGGYAWSRKSHFAYRVDQPRKRTLLSVRKVKTDVWGRDLGKRFETEVNVEIEALEVLEKLHIGSARLHFLSTRPATPEDAAVTVTTKGSRIEGMSLNGVDVAVTLDDEPLCFSGDAQQLSAFYAGKPDDYKKKYGWRYKMNVPPGSADPHPHHHKFTLVREIHLSGPPNKLADVSVDGNTITWKGFGKIILGEVHVKGNDRQVNMVRLAMGSDGGGSGAGPSGASNGGNQG